MMRYWQAIWLAGICLAVLSLAGIAVSAIPESRTVSLSLEDGQHESMRLDGRYASHISLSFSAEDNAHVFLWMKRSTTAAGALSGTWIDGNKTSFSCDLPASQNYYILVNCQIWQGNETAVDVHYTISGLKVDYSRIFIPALAVGIWVLIYGRIWDSAEMRSR